MGKKYLLLRNNKQSGPFSLEELTSHGLKKNDLIWVEGESAGWRSPDEVSAIQSILNLESAPVVVASAPAENLSSTTTSNRHIYVSMPGSTKSSSPVPITSSSSSTSSVEAELSPEQKLEQKAALLREKALNYQATAEPELDTKYSRSLDDIKQEYSTWMRSQQSGGSKPVGKTRPVGNNDSSNWILRGAVVLGAVALAGIGYLLVQDKTKAPSFIASAHQNATEGVAKPVVSNPPIAARSKPALTQKLTEKIAVDQRKKKKTVLAQKAIVDDKKPVEKPPVVVTESVAKKEPPAIPVARPVAKPTINNSVTASGYSESEGDGRWTVVVNNNSSESLKMVAVDVHFAKEGKKTDTKTVYLNNIAPGGTATATVKLPRKAASVTYKIGLISSERGGIFFARN